MPKASVQRAEPVASESKKEPRTYEELVEAIWKLISPGLEVWAKTEEAAGGIYISAELRKAHLLNSLRSPARTPPERAKFTKRLKRMYRNLTRLQ